MGRVGSLWWWNFAKGTSSTKPDNSASIMAAKYRLFCFQHSTLRRHESRVLVMLLVMMPIRNSSNFSNIKSKTNHKYTRYKTK